MNNEDFADIKLGGNARVKVEALRVEAVAAGDLLQVALCAAALEDDDEHGWNRCMEAIQAAEAMGE
jgi:hypothetical protein